MTLEVCLSTYMLDFGEQLHSRLCMNGLCWLHYTSTWQLFTSRFFVEELHHRPDFGDDYYCCRRHLHLELLLLDSHNWRRLAEWVEHWNWVTGCISWKSHSSRDMKRQPKRQGPATWRMSIRIEKDWTWWNQLPQSARLIPSAMPSCLRFWCFRSIPQMCVVY